MIYRGWSSGAPENIWQILSPMCILAHQNDMRSELDMACKKGTVFKNLLNRPIRNFYHIAWRLPLQHKRDYRWQAFQPCAGVCLCSRSVTSAVQQLIIIRTSQYAGHLGQKHSAAFMLVKGWKLKNILYDWDVDTMLLCRSNVLSRGFRQVDVPNRKGLPDSTSTTQDLMSCCSEQSGPCPKQMIRSACNPRIMLVLQLLGLTFPADPELDSLHGAPTDQQA